jgi:hypothetical protein
MTDDPNAQPPTEGEPELPVEPGLSDDQELANEELAESGEPEPPEDEAESEADAEAEAEAPRAPAGRPAPPRRRASGAGAGAGMAGAVGRSRGVAIDPALRIRDRASEIFVAGTVLIFVAIFFYAMAFGHGGALSPKPTPLPSGLESLAPVASPAKTPAPIQTEFQVPTHSPGPSVAPSPS